MSDSQIATAAETGFDKPDRRYQLSDDLAKLCLPQEWRDSYRTLAWVNSICALFLIVGLVGLRAPKVIIRPLSKVEDVVPVVFTPPEEAPKPEVVQTEEPQEQPSDAPVDTPQVVTVAAVADSSSVAFAVPVQGAVAIAPTAQAASPPPPIVKQAPAKGPVTFDPNAAGNRGSYPKPEYPVSALRHGNQGTVMVEFNVDAAGNVTNGKVFKSSGFSVLDEAALEVVLKKWHFPPGPPRLYQSPIIFQLQ